MNAVSYDCLPNEMEEGLMMGAVLSCPKCKSSMEEGFIPDGIDDARFTTAAWFEGQPKRSFWTGVKTARKDRHPVRTYRCTGCGYLECYA